MGFNLNTMFTPMFNNFRFWQNTLKTHTYTFFALDGNTKILHFMVEKFSLTVTSFWKLPKIIQASHHNTDTSMNKM
jgi:hypothetical protein